MRVGMSRSFRFDFSTRYGSQQEYCSIWRKRPQHLISRAGRRMLEHLLPYVPQQHTPLIKEEHYTINVLIVAGKTTARDSVQLRRTVAMVQTRSFDLPTLTNTSDSFSKSTTTISEGGIPQFSPSRQTNSVKLSKPLYKTVSHLHERITRQSNIYTRQEQYTRP